MQFLNSVTHFLKICCKTLKVENLQECDVIVFKKHQHLTKVVGFTTNTTTEKIYIEKKNIMSSVGFELSHTTNLEYQPTPESAQP